VLFAANGALPLLTLVSVIYLLTVLVAAGRWGLTPALVAEVGEDVPEAMSQ
jgi:hypothetical protein